MARKRYLKKTPLEEARKLFLAGIDSSKLASETVPVEDGLNRITAEPVFAKISSPHYQPLPWTASVSAPRIPLAPLSLSERNLPGPWRILGARCLRLCRHGQLSSWLGQRSNHD